MSWAWGTFDRLSIFYLKEKVWEWGLKGIEKDFKKVFWVDWIWGLWGFMGEIFGDLDYWK
jgi:hypothetical protein